MTLFENSTTPEETVRNDTPNPEVSVQPGASDFGEAVATERVHLSVGELAEQPASGDDLFADGFVPHESVATLTDWNEVRSLLQQRNQEAAAGEASRPEFLERLTNWQALEGMIGRGVDQDGLHHDSAPDSLSMMPPVPNLVANALLNYELPESIMQTVPLEFVPVSPLEAAETMLLGTEELTEYYMQRRAAVGAMVPAVQDRLGQIGISGRGEDDLLQIFAERNGTYNDGGGTGGGSIMVWGVDRASELSPEQVLDNLEEMGIRAINYSTLTNPTRMSLDPNPGGIVILNPGYQMDIRNSPSSALGREGELVMGETTIGLTPLNFDQVVEGVIPYAAFRDIAEERARLSEIMRTTYADQPNPNPEAWNAAYERKQVLERLAGLLVAEQMLNRLDQQRSSNISPS